MPDQTVVLPTRLARKARSGSPTSSVARGQAVVRPDNFFVEESIQNLRNQGTTVAAIRELGKKDGNVSAALFHLVEIACSGFRLGAFTTGTNEFSFEATQVAQTIVSQLDTLYRYDKGYNDKRTVDAVIETLLREVALTGGVGLELVLNEMFLPARLKPIAYSDIDWLSDGNGGKYPQQRVAGQEPIPLTFPTIWFAESHLEADQTYATSLLRASVEMAIYYKEFVEDMRRVVNRNGHSRTVATLDAEAVRASAPTDVQQDPKKLKTYMDDMQTSVTEVLNALTPEDAIVVYNLVEIENQDLGGTKSDYTELLKTLGGMSATSLKSNPSILGMRIGGSQSMGNTETQIYLRICRAIQRPVKDLLSRAMTLAVRLHGVDAYCKLRFLPIDLRPESELEAFRTMREERILRRLSLGLITDQQAAFELDLPYNPNAPQLSGTGFMESSSGATANALDVPLQDDTLGRALQPDTPRRAGGRSQ